MLFKRLVEGDVQKADSAKVVVYTCPFDSAQTETKVISFILNYLQRATFCFSVLKFLFLSLCTKGSISFFLAFFYMQLGAKQVLDILDALHHKYATLHFSQICKKNVSIVLLIA